MFRALVASACIAIIAAVGYWFWMQYQTTQDATATQSFAEARAACVDAGRRFVANISNHADADRCLQQGYLQNSDIEALMRGETIR